MKPDLLVTNHAVNLALPTGPEVIPHIGADFTPNLNAAYPELFTAFVRDPYSMTRNLRLVYQSLDLNHSVSLLQQLITNGWRVPAASHTFSNGSIVRIENYVYVLDQVAESIVSENDKYCPDKVFVYFIWYLGTPNYFGVDRSRTPRDTISGRFFVKAAPF